MAAGEPMTEMAVAAAAPPPQPVPSTRNSDDEEYPWKFTGRLWFRPALVREPPAGSLPTGVSAVSLFGWTLGGTVALQYDDSPVRPPSYLEFVRMGALVSKRGALGQWGSRLFVSSTEAEVACQDIWGVPAEEAAIAFEESGTSLSVDAAPPVEREAGADGLPSVRVSGWAATRSGSPGAKAVGGLPVLWTPTLKALWAPFVPLPPAGDGEPAALPTNMLRLSATSLRLNWCFQMPSPELGVPLPVGLTVDGVDIEIGECPQRL